MDNIAGGMAEGLVYLLLLRMCSDQLVALLLVEASSVLTRSYGQRP